MIVPTGHGYKVTSEDGRKNLSRDDLTKQEAQKRLLQVEYFKRRDAAKGK